MMEENARIKPVKWSYAKQGAAVFMGTYYLLGFGLIGASLFVYFFLRSSFGNLLVHQDQCYPYYIHIYMSLAAGVCAVIGASIVLIAKGRCRVATVVILVVFLAPTIAAAVLGFIYYENYSIMNDCANDVYGSSHFYGQPGMDEVTQSWDNLQARHACCVTVDHRREVGNDRYTALSEECTVLAYKDRTYNNNAFSCSDAFMEWQGWNWWEADEACRLDCHYSVIQDTLQKQSLTIPILATITGSFELLLIIYQLLSMCPWSKCGECCRACRMNHSTHCHSESSRKQNPGRVGVETSCTMCTKTISWSCVCTRGDADPQSPLADALVPLPVHPESNEERVVHPPLVKKEIEDDRTLLVDI